MCLSCYSLCGRERELILDHVMPREKRCQLWTAVSGLLALIIRAYCNFSLWHHEFIKATRLLTNEIYPHKALPLVCAADHSQTFAVWSLGPSPLLLVMAVMKL